MHCVLVFDCAEIAFWRMCTLTPLVELDVIATEIQYVLGQPYAVHLGVAAHCGAESVPPDEVEVLLTDNILPIKQQPSGAISPISLKCSPRGTAHCLTQQLKLYILKGRLPSIVDPPSIVDRSKCFASLSAW